MPLPFPRHWKVRASLARHAAPACVALLNLQGCRHAPPPPALMIVVDRPADQATLLGPPDTPLVAVSSATGIGSLSLIKASGHWPDTVGIGLRYGDGRPFTRLEQVRIESGMLSCTTSLGRPDAAMCEPTGSPPPPGGVVVLLPVRRGDGAVSVRVPAQTMGAASDTIKVSWVDVFR